MSDVNSKNNIVIWRVIFFVYLFISIIVLTNTPSEMWNAPTIRGENRGNPIPWLVLFMIGVFLFKMAFFNEKKHRKDIEELSNKGDQSKKVTESKKTINDNTIDLSQIQFKSTSHIRFENGVDVSGPQIGSERLIEIKNHEEIKGAYSVTIYNLKGLHPFWQDNIQMAPKKMKIVKQTDEMIELKGFGIDNVGSSFDDYGIIIYINNRQIDKIVLNLFDRNIKIEYLK